MKRNYDYLTARITPLEKRKLELIAFNNDTTISKAVRSIIEKTNPNERL